MRQFRHGDGPAALRGDPADLGAHGLWVPRRQDRDREEAIRIGAGPIVDVPVVVGRHHDQRDLFAVHVEVAGRETGEGREAHRCEDAVAVHVANALVDVVDAGAHLREPGGVTAPLLGRP